MYYTYRSAQGSYSPFALYADLAKFAKKIEINGICGSAHTKLKMKPQL